MSNVKISALPAATTPLTGTELVPLVQSGVTSQVAVSNIKTAPAGSNTQVQFNNSGAFGASANFTWDGSTLALTGAVSATTTGKVGTTLGVGAATPSASGAGITFPATQSASTDANTLDDYEEGTWTPVDGSGASLSFTTANATYTKVGRFVSLVCNLSFPSTASASVANISGFPFTIATNAYPPAVTMTDALINVVGNGRSATTGMRLWKQGSNQFVTNVEMSLKSLDFVINYSV